LLDSFIVWRRLKSDQKRTLIRELFQSEHNQKLHLDQICKFIYRLYHLSIPQNQIEQFLKSEQEFVLKNDKWELLISQINDIDMEESENSSDLSDESTPSSPLSLSSSGKNRNQNSNGCASSPLIIVEDGDNNQPPICSFCTQELKSDDSVCRICLGFFHSSCLQKEYGEQDKCLVCLQSELRRRSRISEYDYVKAAISEISEDTKEGKMGSIFVPYDL
jgi:hypothetical protein